LGTLKTRSNLSKPNIVFSASAIKHGSLLKIEATGGFSRKNQVTDLEGLAPKYQAERVKSKTSCLEAGNCNTVSFESEAIPQFPIRCPDHQSLQREYTESQLESNFSDIIFRNAHQL
jgi:hypothetical protein